MVRMTTMVHVVLVLALSFVGASKITAQDPGSSGPFLGTQNAVMVDNNTWRPGITAPVQLSEDALYYKKGGFGPSRRTTQVGPRDLRLQGILGLGPGAGRPTLGSFSLGGDRIPTDTTGTYVSSSVVWAAVLFSVERGSPGPGVIAMEAARPDGHAADIFCYVPRTIHPAVLEYSETLTRAADSTEMGLYSDVAAAGNIVGMDTQLPLFYLDPAVASGFPSPLQFFFTLSPASVATGLYNSWFTGVGLPSAATILRCTWSAGGWSTPTVFFDYTDLGLAPTDEIDALSVAYAEDRLIFSTTNPSIDELRHVYWGTDSPTVSDLKEDGGGTVSSKICGRIDAVCGKDPGGIQGINNFYGVPSGPPGGPFPMSTHVAAHRSCDPAGSVFFEVSGSGWTPRGPASDIFAAAYVIPNASGPPTIETIGFEVRSPADPGAGRRSWRLPAGSPPGTSLWGFPLGFATIALDPATGRIGLSRIVYLDI